MLTLPDAALMILGAFASLFTRPVWGHVQVLVTGALLCRGPHTVAAILRVMGLADDGRFGEYHRVLSRALHAEERGDVLRAEVDQFDGDRALTLESASLGVAVSDAAGTVTPGR